MLLVFVIGNYTILAFFCETAWSLTLWDALTCLLLLFWFCLQFCSGSWDTTIKLWSAGKAYWDSFGRGLYGGSKLVLGGQRFDFFSHTCNTTFKTNLLWKLKYRCMVEVWAFLSRKYILKNLITVKVAELWKLSLYICNILYMYMYEHSLFQTEVCVFNVPGADSYLYLQYISCLSLCVTKVCF